MIDWLFECVFERWIVHWWSDSLNCWFCDSIVGLSNWWFDGRLIGLFDQVGLVAWWIGVLVYRLIDRLLGVLVTWSIHLVEWVISCLIAWLIDNPVVSRFDGLLVGQVLEGLIVWCLDGWWWIAWWFDVWLIGWLIDRLYKDSFGVDLVVWCFMNWWLDGLGWSLGCLIDSMLNCLID